jgi:peptidoglycan/xylan/chitin deacetylase (PgdA/CDA1 family)
VIYRYEIILAAIILLLTGSFAISSKDGGKAFPPVQRYPYRIALTFDDGPHPGFTKEIIKTLKQEDVKATFFIVGSQALKFPELLRLISTSGHEVESHTMTHPNLKNLSKLEERSQLILTKQLIKNITNQDSNYFRPPGGQYDARTVEVAKSLGLEIALWTVFPKDHDQNDPEVIYKIVMEEASDGGVIILHSGRTATLKALPKIIKELKNRGYYFVTISQLNSCHYPNEVAWLK